MTKLIATLLAATFVLAGCNTVRGVGQDIQKAGSALEGASRK
ncbi:entericidin A/B family lipoprotein [Ramlibacter sp. AN1015]